jgi:hypothetical protein
MPLGWLFILSLSLFFSFYPGFASFPAIFLFLSAYLLSSLSLRKRRFFMAASVFFLFWYFLRLLFSLPGDGILFYPASFLVYVFLGLHLFFIWTPVEMGRGFNRVFRKILGEKIALITAICLMVLCLVIPSVLEDAFMVKKTLRRFKGLSLKSKVALWAQTLMRLTFQRIESLGRTLTKRQDDLV